MPVNPKIRFQWITVLTGIVLMGIKMIAWYLTGSNIILTDALESIVNIAGGGFGLYSLYLAGKPRDLDHPYGHGKIEYISAGLEGGMIGLAGLGILVKSIYNLIHPEALGQLDTGIAIVAIAGVINYALGTYAGRTGKKHHSLTLIASGQHLKTDAYSTVGMVVGLLLILVTGWFWLDSALAMIIALYILYTSIRIVRRSVSGIMDEADFDLISKVVDHLEQHRQPNWIDIHNLRIIKFGLAIHIDCHVTLPWYFTTQEGHEEIEKVEALINESLPNNLESFIHIDPCVEESCTLCAKPDCQVRRHPFTHSVRWTPENVMKNKKHESATPHPGPGNTA